MRSLYIGLVALILFISVLIPANAQPFARAYVDKDAVNINESIALTILVEGGNSHGNPTLTSMPNFNVVSRSQESEYTLIGSKMTNRSKFTYLMVAKKTGVYKIGEANVNVDGSVLHVYPVSVTVISIGNAVKTPTYAPFKSPSTQSPLPDFASSWNNGDIIFEANVDDRSPYENEQIVYTATIYFRQNIDNTDLKPPTFKDFVVETLDERKQFNTTVNGENYVAYQQAFALFPTKPGTIVIAPAYLSGRMLKYNDPLDRIFGNYEYENFKLMSKPITISVQKLPAAPNTFKNSVGEFSVSSDITKTTLKTGESAKLRIIVTGEGNIMNVEEPQFSFSNEFKKNFKIYKSTPIMDITNRIDRITGGKIFNYDIVPLKVGKYVIPQAELTYFSPHQMKYKQLKSDVIKIDVLQGTSNENLDLTNVGDKENNQNQITTASDLIDIHRSGKALKNIKIGVKEFFAFVIMFISPIIIVLALYLWLKRQNYIQANADLVRERTAFKAVKKKLGKLKSYTQKSNEKLFFEMLDNVIKEYMGDKFSVPSGTLTPLEIEKKLKEYKVSRNSILLLSQILKHCEELQYSSNSNAFGNTEEALNDTLRILKEIEKEIRI